MANLSKEPKQVLKRLPTQKQAYYQYLAQRCLAEFSRAEDSFEMHNYPLSATALFGSVEFFWKALTILSNQSFEEKHPAGSKDVQRISSDVIPAEQKLEVTALLSSFPKERRELAIYGYYEKSGKALQPPMNEFTKDTVTTDLEKVRRLLGIFMKIHYHQQFSRPVRVGVLSGYVEGTKDENPCQDYAWSSFRRAEEWQQDLNSLKVDNEDIFQASIVSVSQIACGDFPVVINPFGETYPERGTGEGEAFATIRELIRNGGIFINAAGNAFTYYWDVRKGERGIVVDSVPAVTGVQLEQHDGKPYVKLLGTHVIRPEALVLWRRFRVTTAWDMPDKNLTGPQKLLLDYTGFGCERVVEKYEANLFRPLLARDDTKIIPFARVDHPSWGLVYPLAAVAHGRGFLIPVGLSLKEKPEYDLLLKMAKELAAVGFKILAAGT